MTTTIRETITLNTQEIVKEIENAVLDIKGRDLVSIDMNGRSDVADVMMICSGTSVKHTAAIADRVSRALKSRKIPIFGIEGERKGDWVLMDAGSVVLHIMIPAARENYQLEQLYGV